jgi:putative oligomerization/nucleic acid binding protein
VDSFWDFFWFLCISFLFFAYLMVLFQIVTDLFRDRSVSGVMKAVWIICLIARGDGMAERHLASLRQAQESQAAYIQSVAGSGGGSSAEEITKAKALLDAGTITQAEYESLKAKALA